MMRTTTILAIVAIVVALGAVISLIPTASSFGPKYLLKPHHKLPTTNPAGSNMTGPAGNSTGGSHGSSIPTTNPAGSNSSNPLAKIGRSLGHPIGGH